MADIKLEPIIEYYDDGKIKRAYTIDENGNKQGPSERYYENGQLFVKYTYKDGKIDGPSERYWINGQLRRKFTFKDGKIDGPFETCEVAKFRENHSDKKDGCVAKKKNLLQKLFRGGR